MSPPSGTSMSKVSRTAAYVALYRALETVETP
jgi:hypothetical protein